MLQTKIIQPKSQQLEFKISRLYQSIFFALTCGVTGSLYAVENPGDTQISVEEKDVQQLESVVVVGNRAGIRTVTESPSPVDVISAEQLTKQGTTTLRETLAKIIPSFSVATVPSQPDGYGAVARSAGLRGLGGGYTLVLVNGKRRHVGALAINKYGYGEGYQAADLDLIPVSAVSRVEVLRDGAAAQYGSDAIAGVINIVLKSADHGGSLNATYGGRAHYSDAEKRNGETYQAYGNFGVALGQDGFIHFAYDYKNQDATTRAGTVSGNIYSQVNGADDPREATVNRHVNKLGLPSVEQLTLSYNAELPLSEQITAYSFTTAGWRDAATGASYRRPNSTSSVTEIYPDGTTPEVLLDEFDLQSVWGIKGDDFYGWSWDVSSSYGKDKQDHSTKDNLNPSLGTASPTTFGLQRYEAYQWVNNIDFKKAFDIGFGVNPLNVAWGVDYRKEGWSSKATDALAYTNGGYIYSTGDQAGSSATVGTFGARVLLPEDEADISRSNTAAYLDLGLDLTQNWFVGIAGRFEHYDDSSGNTWNGKLTSRYEFTPQLALRGTVSTGFIAPSLYQQGFASTGIVSTVTNGVRSDVYSKSVRTDSALGQALGAEALKPTKSTNYSLGLTYSPIKNLNIALDAYRIDLKDRITSTDGLTGTGINAILAANGFSNVNYVTYYANLFDTQTDGIDLIADYTQEFEKYGRVRWSLGFNYNKTKITGIADNPSQLDGISVERITRRTRGMITDADPKTKFTLGANWQYKKFDLNTRLSRYGSYIARGETESLDQTFDAKWIVDLDATYNLTDNLAFTVGADNLLNTYPDKSNIVDSLGENKYAQLSPFGLYGGYYYGRISYRF
ncbi:TonB-dependent receptor [Acinetobacter qingfengensis]|uniref:Uncharacterized protein n=1 Tax=Acinetobacter qingfengensis TaxID=1262585 RepID=A0A1E7R412_9GAMM|nr:TonB-dependent receptor [Acinetobacter qingfengensis]KAA8733742.1 TonB-dependent receptor [Acinetobacter qingfengensis]OEY94036.1 hypothetical protein BJI46_13600 [Acinetobacter qingfengensis]